MSPERHPERHGDHWLRCHLDAVLWAAIAAVAAAAGWSLGQRWPGLLDSPAGMALVAAAAVVAAAVLTGVRYLLDRRQQS